MQSNAYYRRGLGLLEVAECSISTKLILKTILVTRWIQQKRIWYIVECSISTKLMLVMPEM